MENQKSVPFYNQFLANNPKEVSPEAWIKAVAMRTIFKDPSWYWDQFSHAQSQLEYTCINDDAVMDAFIESKLVCIDSIRG